MFRRLHILFIAVLVIGAAAHGTHLGNVNLSSMRHVYAQGNPGEFGYFRFLFDSSSGDYYIEYVGEDDDGNAITEITKYEPATKIDPSLGVLVSRTSNSNRYEYAVTNGPAARQDLTSFGIVLSNKMRKPPLAVHDIPTDIPMNRSIPIQTAMRRKRTPIT